MIVFAWRTSPPTTVIWPRRRVTDSISMQFSLLDHDTVLSITDRLSMLRCDFSGQCPVTVNMCQYNVMSDFYNSPNYYYCLPCCHSKIFWVYVFALALCWIDLHASMLHVDRPNGHVADPWYDDWYCWVCVDHIHLENVTPCDSTMGLGIVKCVGPISCLTLCCLTGGGFRSQLYFCEIYFCSGIVFRAFCRTTYT